MGKAKKSKIKQPGGFVDYPGRDVEFLPSMVPRLQEVIRHAILVTSGVDFGDLTLLSAVEAPRDGVPTLFIEIQQKDINDPIIFSIQVAMLLKAVGKPSWGVTTPRTVRNYRGSRRYKFLGEPVKPMDPIQLYTKPDSAMDKVMQDRIIANMAEQLKA